MFSNLGLHSPSFCNGFQITRIDGTSIRYDREVKKTGKRKIVVHRSGGLLKAQFMVQNFKADAKQITDFFERVTGRKTECATNWYSHRLGDDKADREDVTAIELTCGFRESEKLFKKRMSKLSEAVFEEFKQSVVTLRFSKIGFICGSDILENVK